MKPIKFKGAAWDSALLAFVKIVTMAAAIAQTKILSVGFSLQQYGTYSQANTIVGIIASFIALGLGDAVNYFYNNKKSGISDQERMATVNTVISIELIAGAVVTAVVLLCQDLIVAYFSNEALKAMLLLIAMKPIADNVLAIYQVLFISAGKAKVIAVRNLAVSMLKLLVMYCAVYLLQSVTAIFALIILLDVLQIVLFNEVFAKSVFRINPIKGDWKQVKTILAYSLPMGVFAITGTLNREVGKLLVSYVATTEEVAIYANCSKVLPFDIVAVSFATVLIPYIMRYVSGEEKESAVKLFRAYLKICYFFAFTMGVAVLIVNEQAISFLYSSEYLPGKSVFIVYIIDSMIRFASMHLIITSAGKSKLLMRYSIVSLVANVVLTIVLYRLLGFVGPAIATVLVSGGYMLAILNRSVKILDARWLDIFDLKDLGLLGMQLAATGTVFAFAHRFLLRTGIHPYISMIAVMILFALTNLIFLKNRIKKVLSIINSLK